MSKRAATLLLLVLLGAAGCSANGGQDRAASGCAPAQAAPCHEPPDHSNGNPGGQGNGGGMGHGMM
jgi:hypothetical protein